MVGEPMPLLAVNVTGKVLPTPAVGIPASFPLPFPLSMKVTPLGRAPVSVKDGAGKPVVSTANNPEVPNVKAALLRLVKAGASSTVKAKLWLAGDPTPLLAVNVTEYVLPVAIAGVPASVPVPFPLSIKVMPPGSAPVSANDGVGLPVAVTVKVPAVPTTSVILFALVIAGGVEGGLTVSPAQALVALPMELLTTTLNCAPLSVVVVAGVV